MRPTRVFTFCFLLAAKSLSAGAQPPPSGVDMELRVYPPRSVSQASLARIEGAAVRILDAAGIVTRWHDCSIAAPEPICASPPHVRVVIVRFVPPGSFVSGFCGEANGTLGLGGLVSIDSGCVAAVGHELRTIPDAPALMRVRDDDISGVILAHEIGHLLGQPHADAGIMRRSLRRVEWEQFVAGKLTFSTRQARALRAALEGKRAERPGG